MTVMAQVLKFLLDNGQAAVSGQALADELHVSRNAIWKAVQQLRERGYHIDSNAKGYTLLHKTIELDPQQISYSLTELWDDLHIEIHDTVESTNDLAKQFAIKHPQRSALFVATHQSKGRGRRGRSFHSALISGLYFSLVFPTMNEATTDIPRYTLVAASAIVEALETLTNQTFQIKWVNDLFYQHKKIGGILSEATTDLESGGISAVIIGIGLNLAGSFAEADAQTQQVAGTIFNEALPDSFNRNQLLQHFLERFGTYRKHFQDKTYLQTYKEHLLGVGKHVHYQKGNISHEGIIEGIDHDGQLLVRDLKGELHTLFSQEVHFSSSQFTD